MKQEDMAVGMEYVNKSVCKWHYQGRVGNSQAGRFKDQHGDYHIMRYDRMEEAPKYPNPPLPHCEERIAFAKGANIENKHKDNVTWWDDEEPQWLPKLRYRVKAEKTKDDLRIEELERRIAEDLRILNMHKRELADLKPTVHY